MRVCHIIPDFFPLYPAPLEYTKCLSKIGIKVDIIAFGREKDENEPEINNVKVRRINLKTHPRFSPKTMWRFISRVRNILQDKQYDLIHVYAFRGCFLLPFFSKKNAAHWLIDIRSGNVNYCNRFLNFLINRITALESLFFSTCITNSNLVGWHVLGHNRRFNTVHIGVDHSKFKPGHNVQLRKRLGIEKERIVVVFAGIIAKKRTPEVMLRGFALAHKECARLFFLVVGGGDMLAPMKNLADKLGLHDSVCFAGQVPYSEVPDYLTAGDIGLAYIPINVQFDCQPPLKTFELLASGLPTVATRTKGNLQIIRDNYNGILVDDKPELLSKAIKELGCNPGMQEKFIKHARYSVKNYEWEKIVREQLLPVYTQALK